MKMSGHMARGGSLLCAAVVLGAFSVPAFAQSEAERIAQRLNQSSPSAVAVRDTTPGRDQVLGEYRPGSDADTIEVERFGLEAELTPQERRLIEQRRDALIKYLYEQQELERARRALESTTRDERLEDLIRSELPLTPEEITDIRRRRQDAIQAENAPLIRPDIKIQSVRYSVDDPEPLVVRVAKGYASSLVFFDETGSPWPIANDGILGDRSSFSSHVVSEKRNVAVFEITAEFRESNALIDLDGLSSPVVVKLVGDQANVDARTSVRIPQFGPMARAAGGTSTQFEEVPTAVIDILNGTIPDGAVEYTLSGAPGRVIFYNDWLYVRTRATLMSPPPKAAVSSPTGFTVYQISPVTHLLFSHEGDVREAQIEERFQVNIDNQRSIFGR
ncbi:hypothetical protein J2T57_001383 [Natronocella acetinitrilica]|uniref:Uncharacterized protein n=1 Tax=Natronocella acetinitrilica TaxID=414046 RepID=A0AAE3G205_9GAMM|nr:DotH/IcmK family type IV secretion protein [Natronocella acetinitrilica]MCP1674281.1 hypothetical protein [Natronocella acetinitrilica]